MNNLDFKNQAIIQEQVPGDEKMSGNATKYVETIVIGGGQAGLSVGYQLKQRNLEFLILDANERPGDSWRKRWDSLRLFTPARYNGLTGMPFPGSPHYFPTKDEMADFLEHYAAHFKLPMKNGIKVDHLSKQDDLFIINAGELVYKAKNVVVAMANYQKPKTPSFAQNLSKEITQFHSVEYRNPSQLKDGDVLIVGAGNSGSEIGMELARSHRIWMSGRDTGHVPFRIETRMASLFLIPLVLRIVFHRIMTINTFAGQKMRKKILAQGGPLVRVKPKDMLSVGIKRVPKVKGVKDGMPLLEDGRVLDVKNVIWCTGFHPGFSWIKLPVLGEREPLHRRGVVSSEPGLYFLGLHFLFAASSSMIQGLRRDAAHIVNDIASRTVQNAAHEKPVPIS
jgi:putative flavoprotein involved in K+ transport